jgi:hypothetical protein
MSALGGKPTFGPAVPSVRIAPISVVPDCLGSAYKRNVCMGRKADAVHSVQGLIRLQRPICDLRLELSR